MKIEIKKSTPFRDRYLAMMWNDDIDAKEYELDFRSTLSLHDRGRSFLKLLTDQYFLNKTIALSMVPFCERVDKGDDLRYYQLRADAFVGGKLNPKYQKIRVKNNAILKSNPPSWLRYLAIMWDYKIENEAAGLEESASFHLGRGTWILKVGCHIFRLPITTIKNMVPFCEVVERQGKTRYYIKGDAFVRGKLNPKYMK